MDRRIADDAKGYGSRLKIELTLTELEVLLGAYTTDAAALHAVVILDLDECVRVHQADRADVLSLFQAELREPDPAFPIWWLDSDGRMPTEPRSFDDLLDLVGGRPLLRAGWHPAQHEATRVIDLLATRLG